MHRYDLPNFVTTRGRIGLRVQRKLLRVQRLDRKRRIRGGLNLFHDGSSFGALGLEASNS